MSREIEDTACLVCKHVAKSANAVQFVCSSPDMFAAACSERCLDESDQSELSMCHVGHVDQIMNSPIPLMALPTHFKMSKHLEKWTIDYFDDEYVPQEGDFLAPPRSSSLRIIPDDTAVFLFLQMDSAPVCVTLDEGTVCIPFWFEAESCKTFEGYLQDKTTLKKITYFRICNIAKEANCHFLAVDFLKYHYDFAILPERRGLNNMLQSLETFVDRDPAPKF